MKKIYMINVSIILILVLTAGISKMPESRQSQMKALISDRICVLNDYYGGKINFSKAKELLESKEKGDILSSDLNNLKNYDSTDIEKILSFKIKDFQYKESSFGYVQGKVKILWRIEDLNKKYSYRQEYEFVIETSNSSYKITKFNKI